MVPTGRVPDTFTFDPPTHTSISTPPTRGGFKGAAVVGVGSTGAAFAVMVVDDVGAVVVGVGGTGAAVVAVDELIFFFVTQIR